MYFYQDAPTVENIYRELDRRVSKKKINKQLRNGVSQKAILDHYLRLENLQHWDDQVSDITLFNYQPVGPHDSEYQYSIFYFLQRFEIEV